MSARRIPSASLLAPVTVQRDTTQLELPASAVSIRKNGVEFRSQNPLPVFTEVSIALKAPLSAKKIQCNGVVVACGGNRHQGFRVSVLFLNVTPALQQRLEALATAG